MPARISISMMPQKDFKLPLFTGQIARGLLLHVINRANPSAAQSLHEANVLKPYTIEPLYFRSKMKAPDGYLLDGSRPCILTVKVLKDDLVEKTLAYLASNDKILIRDNVLLLNEIRFESKDYSKIMKDAKEIDRFVMDFMTPTYLSKKGSDYFSLLPEPRAVMMNLLRIWNAFAEDKVGKEDYRAYWRWLEKNIGINMYELRTMPIRVQRMKAKTGFVGRVSYIIGDRRYSRLTDALLTFAEFSNVGGGRTAGMGVVRVSRETEGQKVKKDKKL